MNQPAQRQSSLDHESLWRDFWANRSEETRNRLAGEYLHLVRPLAVKLLAKLPEHLELEDLVQAGSLGLLKSIERFDGARNVRFAAYCLPRIRGAILDFLRQIDWVPRVTRAKLKARGEKTAIFSSLDAPVYSDGNLSTFGDSLADPHATDPAKTVANRDELDNFLKPFSKRDRRILYLRFAEGMSRREISDVLGCSEALVFLREQKISDRIRVLRIRPRNGFVSVH